MICLIHVFFNNVVTMQRPCHKKGRHSNRHYIPHSILKGIFFFFTLLLCINFIYYIQLVCSPAILMVFFLSIHLDLFFVLFLLILFHVSFSYFSSHSTFCLVFLSVFMETKGKKRIGNAKYISIVCECWREKSRRNTSSATETKYNPKTKTIYYMHDNKKKTRNYVK